MPWDGFVWVALTFGKSARIFETAIKMVCIFENRVGSFGWFCFFYGFD